MASHLAEGNVMLNPPVLKKLTPPELRALETEIDKLARDVRAENPPLDDNAALQKRARKLQRLNQSLLVLRSFLMSKR